MFLEFIGSCCGQKNELLVNSNPLKHSETLPREYWDSRGKQAVASLSASPRGSGFSIP